MAIHELEPIESPQDLSDTPEEDEVSPMDTFRSGLHTMVMDIEDQGLSAMSNLIAIRAELRDKRVSLMRQSVALEQRLREGTGNQDADLVAEFSRNQEEQNFVYHQLEWLGGYVRDPVRTR